MKISIVKPAKKVYLTFSETDGTYSENLVILVLLCKNLIQCLYHIGIIVQFEERINRVQK